MTAYTGQALYVSWTYLSGTVPTTVALTGDYRRFSYTPSIDLHDQSAGADADKTYVTGLKDGQCSFDALMQASGTALTNALLEGTSGTLIVGSEGTTSGKPKKTIPAISLGVVENHAYNDLVSISVTFQKNGATSVSSY